MMIQQAPVQVMQARSGLQPGTLGSGVMGQPMPQYIGQQQFQVQSQLQPQKPVHAQIQPAQAQPQLQGAQAQQMQRQQSQHIPGQAPGQQQVPAETPRQVIGHNTPNMAPIKIRQASSPISPQTKSTVSISAIDPAMLSSNPGVMSSRGAVVLPGVNGGLPVTTVHSGMPVTTVSSGMPVGVPAVLVQQVQGLEQRVRELEQVVEQKDQQILELQAALSAKSEKKTKASPKKAAMGTGFQKLLDSKPEVPYTATDPNDPVDVRLEEFYNSIGSAVQFRRINHGFYRFGETIVELTIINHKLMARTEDGWNRSKFGPIEKFLMYYEAIEREKAGIAAEA